jgi:hypothetical protein
MRMEPRYADSADADVGLRCFVRSGPLVDHLVVVGVVVVAIPTIVTVAGNMAHPVSVRDWTVLAVGAGDLGLSAPLTYLVTRLSALTEFPSCRGLTLT